MKLWSTRLHALWLTTFCNAQPSVGPVIQPIPCTKCTVDAAYSTTTAFGAEAPERTNSPTSEVYVVISSYGITSSSSTNGACNVVELPPVTLSPPFSVFSTPGIDDIGYTVASSFIGYLGLGECGFQRVGPADPPQVTDAVPTSSLPSSSSALSSLSTLSSSSSQPDASSPPAVSEASLSLDTKEKVVLGTVLPTTLLVLAILATLAWSARRKRKLTAAAATNKDTPTSRVETRLYLRRKAELAGYERRLRELETQRRGLGQETLLYLQQKSELEDYGRRVHELEARSHVYEIG